jgi:hypothetical protein
MLLTIERIHNSLEKLITENRNLSVATNGKTKGSFHRGKGFPRHPTA